MLRTYYRGGRWHTLATHPHPDTGQPMLLEHAGACPGDPDSDVIALLGPIEPEEVADRTRVWLANGWADASREPAGEPALLVRPWPGPSVMHPDRRATADTAWRAVRAALGAPAPVCLFPNPAAHAAARKES